MKKGNYRNANAALADGTDLFLHMVDEANFSLV